MAHSREKTIAVLNAVLNDYLNNKKPTWNSTSGTLEAILSTGISLVSNWWTGSSDKIEAKDREMTTNESKRTHSCDNYKEMFRAKLSTLEGCLEITTFLGIASTTTQHKYRSKPSIMQRQGKSDFADRLHVCRTFIIFEYILNNPIFKPLYLAELTKRKEHLQILREKYNTELLILATLGNEESTTEALEEKLITQSPIVSALPVERATAKVRRGELDKQRATLNEYLLNLSYIGDLSAAQEAARKNLLNMYQFPAKRSTPEYFDGREKVPGIPNCFQPFYFLIYWEEQRALGKATLTWMQLVESADKEKKAVEAVSSSTASSSGSGVSDETPIRSGAMGDVAIQTAEAIATPSSNAVTTTTSGAVTSATSGATTTTTTTSTTSVNAILTAAPIPPPNVVPPTHRPSNPPPASQRSSAKKTKEQKSSPAKAGTFKPPSVLITNVTPVEEHEHPLTP
jgi:hypothetical protein